MAGTTLYSHDAAERVSSIQDPAAGAFEYTYNQYNGLISKVTCTNTGGFVEYSYDLMDRLTNILWCDSETNVLRSFAYAYSPADMITNVVYEDGDNDAYLYDDFDRLTNWESYVSASTSTWTVAYDRAGNIQTEVVDEATTNTWTYGLGNRVSTWGTGTAAYFDDAGCATTLTYSGSLTLGLTWNGRYQLAAVTTNGSVAESYQFDALGRRTRIVTGSATNYLVYDGPHCIADVNATGGLVRTYTYGPGIDNLLAFTTYTGATAVTYYPLTDHLGTIHALVDSSGTIVESYRFDAWGRVLGVYDSADQPITESSVGNRYLWQGREYSFKTGFYYFRARWYDPITGRWLSNDPIGISGGLNQYVFCGNNSVNMTDPFGLASVEERMQSAIDDATSGRKKRKALLEALEVGNREEARRIAGTIQHMGSCGEYEGTHTFVDIWENTEQSQQMGSQQSREFRGFYLRFELTEANKSWQRWEILRQEMFILWAESQLSRYRAVRQRRDANRPAFREPSHLSLPRFPLSPPPGGK